MKTQPPLSPESVNAPAAGPLARPARTHAARYLDSGFYTVSDAAASALCRALGKPLPRHGWQRDVSLRANGRTYAATLQRTPTSLQPGRPWKWAIFALRPDGERPPVCLGRAFRFSV